MLAAARLYPQARPGAAAPDEPQPGGVPGALPRRLALRRRWRICRGGASTTRSWSTRRPSSRCAGCTPGTTGHHHRPSSPRCASCRPAGPSPARRWARRRRCWSSSMAEQGLTVSATEATLLLLGIYEDTGGLQLRDDHAARSARAAWLLEHGANLLLVDKFLHHPLTDEQRRSTSNWPTTASPTSSAGTRSSSPLPPSTSRWRRSRPWRTSCATCTSRMRLFMLVDMGDRIQLVARSTSDADRRRQDRRGPGRRRPQPGRGRRDPRGQLCTSVYETLVYLLQSHVRPPVTVAQIMSYGAPQTLVAQRYHRRGRRAHAPLRLRGFPGGGGRPDRRHADAARDRPGHAPRPEPATRSAATCAPARCTSRPTIRSRRCAR